MSLNRRSMSWPPRGNGRYATPATSQTALSASYGAIFSPRLGISFCMSLTVASASTCVCMSMVLVIGSPRMAGFFAHNGRGGARHGGHASHSSCPGLTRAIHGEVRPVDCAKPLSTAEQHHGLPDQVRQ